LPFESGSQSSECCVYPDSALKFHLAYDPRNHQSNYAASQQLFNSYPQSMRELAVRPGNISFAPRRIDRSWERDCNAPR
jgi:hypothetical protein